MGYYSKVALVLNRHGVAVLNTSLNNADTSETVQKEVHYLLQCADCHCSDPHTGSELWYWDWLKWYQSFVEIEFIESLLENMAQKNYSFIRMGEDYDDLEMRGNFFDNPFHLEVLHEISFSDAGDSPEQEETMNPQNKYQIKFAGIDGFDRSVFVSTDGRQYFKSIALMPQPDFYGLSAEEQETLLCTLCDTDEFDGEPGYHVHRSNFILVE